MKYRRHLFVCQGYSDIIRPGKVLQGEKQNALKDITANLPAVAVAFGDFQQIAFSQIAGFLRIAAALFMVFQL